jgi:hypothetical protein
MNISKNKNGRSRDESQETGGNRKKYKRWLSDPQIEIPKSTKYYRLKQVTIKIAFCYMYEGPLKTENVTFYKNKRVPCDTLKRVCLFVII